MLLFQTKDLDTYDSDYADVSNAKAVLMANLSNYGSDVISKEKATQEKNNESLTAELERYKERVKTFEQRLNTDLSTQETLILEEVSRSKMSEKVKDPEAIKQNISHKPIDYIKLNQLSKDFGKRFVPQQELSAEQAFWLQTSNPNNEESDISPGRIEAPSELPKEHIKSMRENDKEEKVKRDMDEIETINIELEHSVAKLLSENKRLHKEIDHLKKIYKNQFDSIKRTRVRTKEHSESLILQLNSKSVENADLKAQIQDKVFVITSLKNNLRKLKGKEIIENATQIPNATTIAPGMFKLDLDPLAPKLLKNRESHIDYLKHTQEQADILRGIVEQAKAKKPLDNALDFACKHAKRIQELLVYVRDTFPNAYKPSEKLVVVTPMNKVKKVRFSEPLTSSSNIYKQVVQIVLWYLDFRCYKHMIGNRSQLMNFVSKFMGNVRFGNDQTAKIIGYGDYQLGNKNTCFIRNLEGVDLLSGSRDTNLYTIYLDDMLKASLICLLSKASKTKSCLWHRRLSHLSFGKTKKSSHQPKAEDTNQEKLYLLHMDLCGLIRVESINWKKYILVIVDDYSRFTWVKFLRSKDEAPDAIIKCIKNIQVHLNATVRNARTDNGTKFVNQTLCEFYENVRISHQTSVSRTPQQNGVVKRQNRTLVEASRIMLIFSKAPLFLWAEAINTACYTQNHSLICLRYNKTPYDLMHDKKPDLSFLHVFGLLYYPTNDSEDFGKLNANADIVPFPVAAAPRAVDIAGSPLSTTIDQDAPSSSTSSTNKQQQSSIISQGVKEPISNAHFDDPCHEPLHDVFTSQESSLNAQSFHSSLEMIGQGTPVDATLYHGMIGSLMYLTSSRPDLIYAVFLCARYQAKPTKKHLHALTDYGFHFYKIPLYCDNKSSIALCCKNVQHSRAKHINVCYHFIKKQVDNGIVELYFVRTEYQLAGIFTKPLPRERFHFLIEKLGMRSMSPETLKRLTEEEDE
ncbi:retrovirus-related pol polyprotein from transposon TNT 1-94 [Tanacetum coccineum]